MITAVFNGSAYARATGLWQYDYGQILRIQGLSLPKAVKIDFSLSETGSESVPRVGVTKDGVTDVPIPDSMLENGDTTMDYDIYAFVYIEDETSGKTTHRITMPVKSRPKPQAFDTPEDAQLFRDAIAAVNESAGRAETAEKLAEAWAHGREDYPEREEDNSKYYAGVSEEKAGAANDAMERAQRLADQVNMNADAVNQDVIRSKGYLEQATKSAAEALRSEEAAKSSETAEQEAQAGAEAAEGQVELHALDAAASASGAELAKTQAQENAKQASEDREAVQKLSDGFSTACEKAVRDIHTAGENQANAVDEAGKKALENIGTGIDNTLTQDGKAADAGATGRAIDDLKGDISNLRFGDPYDGVDLVTKFADEISGYTDPGAWIRARIRANNFDGILVNDYIPFTTTNGLSFKARVAGIDPYYEYGDSVVGHHIDFICEELWRTLKPINPVNYNNGLIPTENVTSDGSSTQYTLTKPMYGVAKVALSGTDLTGWTYDKDTYTLTFSTAPAAGTMVVTGTGSEYPWLASDAYLYVNSLAGHVANGTGVNPGIKRVDYTNDGIYHYLPDWLKAVIIEKRFLLNERYSTSGVLSDENNWSWVNLGKLWFPTEVEVYGCPVWGSKGDYGLGASIQYPLFMGNMRRAKKAEWKPLCLVVAVDGRQHGGLVPCRRHRQCRQLQCVERLRCRARLLPYRVKGGIV